MSREFYIGWKNEIPAGSKKRIKILIGALLFVLLFLAFVAVKFQKPFNNYIFQLGNQTEIAGTLYTSPVPMLVADQRMLPDSLSREILLLGYGKFGATGILDNIEAEKGPLQGKKATLKGTLIYGDGKTLMELTAKEKSLIKIGDLSNDPDDAMAATSEKLLQGEILDPKCYFGVMKPGEGKVHKSCAIRCISGGIPPVLRHETGVESDPYEYYILLGEDGKSINVELLPYVAENIEVTARIGEFQNWNMAYINSNEISN